MNDFINIINGSRARFTKTLLAIATLGTAALSYTSSIQPGESVAITSLLIGSCLSFALCFLFFAKTTNYRISAYLMVIEGIILVTYTISTVNLPLVAGAFAFIPAIIACATLTCSIPAGALTLFYFLGFILFTSSIPDQALQNIDFDFTIYIDRCIAAIFTFVLTAMFEHTFGLALKQIDAQNKQIQIKEKLSSLGVFVGGIAHEINNPLAVLMGAFRIIKQRLRKSPENLDLERWINSVDQGTDRISHVIQSLLFFTNDSKQRYRPQQFSTLSAVEDAIKLLRTRLDLAHITCTTQLDSKISIEGNLLHLSSIVRIFIENSVDSLVDAPVPNPTIEISDRIHNNSYIIAVKDNGVGIKDDIKGKILDPFFTTKEQGRGSGMGLSLAYSIAKVLNWDIQFTSAKHQTIFTVIIHPFLRKD